MSDVQNRNPIWNIGIKGTCHLPLAISEIPLTPTSDIPYFDSSLSEGATGHRAPNEHWPMHEMWVEHITFLKIHQRKRERKGCLNTGGF
jgi:hypothetical protein